MFSAMWITPACSQPADSTVHHRPFEDRQGAAGPKQEERQRVRAQAEGAVGMARRRDQRREIQPDAGDRDDIGESEVPPEVPQQRRKPQSAGLRRPQL
jgi:hypothetical protein